LNIQIICYSSQQKDLSERLSFLLNSLASDVTLVVHRTLESFSSDLGKFRGGEVIAIVVAASKEELADIVSIKDLLVNRRVLLVLPDLDEETVARGHALRPRFVSHIHGNLGEVAAVLKKMIEGLKHSTKMPTV
jgi:hypothetical protein